jgi:hypothetical protein
MPARRVRAQGGGVAWNHVGCADNHTAVPRGAGQGHAGDEDAGAAGDRCGGFAGAGGVAGAGDAVRCSSCVSSWERSGD